MTATADRRIRGLRPPKPRVDPFTPHGWLVEEERRPNEPRPERALTVFLAGAEFAEVWSELIARDRSRS